MAVTVVYWGLRVQRSRDVMETSDMRTGGVNKGEMRIGLLAAVLVTAMAFSGPASARIIYVDANAPTPGTGSSWQKACKYLQDGLQSATAGDEIRVAQGVYRPDRGMNQVLGDRKATFKMLSGVAIRGGYAGIAAEDPNIRDIAKYESVLSGDLAGNDVLSADPCDFVFPKEYGYWPRPKEWCLVHESTRRENSLHVVTSGGVDQTAVLEGFTITAGNTLNPPYEIGEIIRLYDKDCGGGLFNSGGSPTVQSCRFVDNSALGEGGAMYTVGIGKPVLLDCRFQHSYTLFGGGAICCGDVRRKVSGAALQMTRCVFEDNTQWWGGETVDCWTCTLSLEGCRFVGNTTSPTQVAMSRCAASFVGCEFARNKGPVIDSSGGTLVLTGCVFEGNWGGGAIWLNEDNARLDKCTFVRNRAQSGGAIEAGGGSLSLRGCIFSGNRANYLGGAMSFWNVSLTVNNSVFVGNKAPQGSALAGYSGNGLIMNSIFQGSQSGEESLISLVPGFVSSEVDVSYSVISGGPAAISTVQGDQVLWGPGNLDVDPCVADPGRWDPNGTPNDPNDDFWVNGDYHLKSQAGRWDPNSASWAQDDVTSPCIDAGDPDTPVGEEPLPNGGRVNMGSYGGTAEASKSYFGGPACEATIAGYINGDCVVDFKDLAILTSRWLGSGSNPQSR
jgi:hypothetical protein